MSKMTTLVMLACLALAAGCAEVDTDASLQPLAATPGGPQLPLCHWISGELRGYEATLYPLKDNPDVMAVEVEDKIVCIDGTDALLKVGIIAVEPSPTIKVNCTICEGTPLPAEVFNDAVKKLGIHSEGI